MNTRRLLLSPLVFLVALLTVLTGGTVSASAAYGPETRVRAIPTATAAAVGHHSSETAGHVGRLRPSQPGLASGSCVATEAEGELGLVCHSFDPRTEVVMADGSRKQIADVQVGDRVRTTDPATWKPVIRTVTALHRNHDTDLADLVVRDGHGNESILHTTQHHRFWDDTRHGWIEAAALTSGDRLHSDDGGVATVASVRTFDGRQWMYDLTINDVHTYYVEAGEESILVHNCGEGMLGENGTQVTSKTLTNRPGYRIDVENPAPGVRPGRLHLQDTAGGKYLYNFETGTFDGIPNALAKQIASDPAVARAIATGSRYLGLAP